MFEKIYNEINKKLHNNSFEDAEVLLSSLEEVIKDKEQKLYFYLLKINILSVLNKKEELLQSSDIFIDEFSTSSDENVLYYLAYTYFNKALIYTKDEEIQKAIDTYSQLILKFESCEDDRIKELLIKSMVNKASRLNDILKLDEAIALYDEVYDSFSDSRGEIFKQVAISLNNKLAILSSLGNEKKTKDLCEFIIEKLSPYNDEMISNIVSSAEVIKDKERFNNSF